MSLADRPAPRPVAERRTVHHGMVWDIVRDTVDFAPGVRFDREYVHHTGAVAVLTVDAEDRVLLIRQYRHPVGHQLWEIPAGLLDVAGEGAHLGALRELAEETGHRAGRLETLLDLRPSPGGSDEVIRVYLATEVTELTGDDGYRRTDEEAEIEIAWVPLDEAVAAALRGELTNGTALAALLALHAHRSLGAQAPTLRAADAPFPERPGHA